MPLSLILPRTTIYFLESFFSEQMRVLVWVQNLSESSVNPSSVVRNQRITKSDINKTNDLQEKSEFILRNAEDIFHGLVHHILINHSFFSIIP